MKNVTYLSVTLPYSIFWNIVFHSMLTPKTILQRSRSRWGGLATISRSPSYFTSFSGTSEYVGRGCMTNGASDHHVEYKLMVYSPVKSTSLPGLE